MNGLVLIGGGGHCKSVLDSLYTNNQYDNIVILDAQLKKNSTIMGVQVFGGDESLAYLYKHGYKNAFISVGSIKTCEIRKKIYSNAKNIGFNFPSIIDSTAAVSDFSKISQGVFVGKNAVINAGAIIDSFSIINSGSIVEHDCKIGEFCHVSVGAVLCGNVMVGNESFIGANSTIIQGKVIGKNTVIGAGSQILHNVPDGNTVYGLY